MSGSHQSSPWVVFISGTSAAILANVAVYPLDIVKTKLQVQIQHRQERGRSGDESQLSSMGGAAADCDSLIGAISHVVHEEGISGLYRGLGSSILGMTLMNCTYFYWSAKARILHQSVLRWYNMSDRGGILKELALGAAGGAMAQLCTNPIAVIAMRQQTSTIADQTKSAWNNVKEIVYNEDGWTGLWKGLKVNLILVVNPTITYGAYEWLRMISVRFRKQIGPIDAFLLGALSKALATIATQPLIVSKTILQSKPPECRYGRPFRSSTEVVIYIVRHEGFRRLYKGLVPRLLKGFLVQGLMMMLKERIQVLLTSVSLLNRLRVQRLTSASY
ncbi:mitochondrial carrier domain-containing protein [Aspergillus alliaceus]|uniref:Mitochondrial carrier domain-containing protein n=1 Tax=Petromyces alliaceus TaxID=209559 RepID=A0A5N7CJH1_PETAA|nr:mitochondrial carrier domain-containing protein [Aspergillus alliaceus]